MVGAKYAPSLIAQFNAIFKNSSADGLIGAEPIPTNLIFPPRTACILELRLFSKYSDQDTLLTHLAEHQPIPEDVACRSSVMEISQFGLQSFIE